MIEYKIDQLLLKYGGKPQVYKVDTKKMHIR